MGVITGVKSLISYFLISLTVTATCQTLEETRELFHGAVLNAEESKTFHESMKEVDDEDASLLAYQAVSEAMLAQVVWNPFTKFSQVLKFDKKITQAVEMDPENIEIRFLRLAIEYNLPDFLGMGTHVKEDLEVILANMKEVGSIGVDPSYGRYIFYFLESSDLCTHDQILAMKETLNKASSM